MNYTKENIFPMYVGKCKVKSHDLEGVFCGFEDSAVKIDLNPKSKFRRVWRPISDCTLLLKSISKMGQEEKNKWGLLRLHPKVRGYGRVTYDTPESFLWLIQHGYAISDKLFELGIAEEI